MRTAPLWGGRQDDGVGGRARAAARRRVRRALRRPGGRAGGGAPDRGAPGRRARRAASGGARGRTVSPPGSTGSPNSPATSGGLPAAAALRGPPYAPWRRLPRARRPARRARGARTGTARRRRPAGARPAPALAGLVRDGRARRGRPVPRGVRRRGGAARAAGQTLLRHPADGHRVRRAAARRTTSRTATPPQPAVRALLAAFQGCWPPRPTGRPPDHPRQHPRPALAGAVRRRPREAAHGLPGHGRRPFAAGAARRRPRADPTRWSGSAASNPAKDLIVAAARLRRDTQGRAEGPAADHRRARRPPRAPATSAHCRALAAQLFPDEAADAHAVGENPVTFEEIGRPDVPEPADAYAAGAVGALQRRRGLSAQPGGGDVLRPGHGVHGRRRGRGGHRRHRPGRTAAQPPGARRGLLGAAARPRARARLGAAARARALELFTVEQNIAAFRGIYLELVSRTPGPPGTAAGRAGVPLPFAAPPRPTCPAAGPPRAAARRPRGPGWPRRRPAARTARSPPGGSRDERPGRTRRRAARGRRRRRPGSAGEPSGWDGAARRQPGAGRRG